MNREQVGKTFVELIKPFVRIPEPKEINESSLLVSDLNVNSTRLVDIILEIEDKFKIRIADEEIGRFERVGDAIDVICEKTVAA